MRCYVPAPRNQRWLNFHEGRLSWFWKGEEKEADWMPEGLVSLERALNEVGLAGVETEFGRELSGRRERLLSNAATLSSLT